MSLLEVIKKASADTTTGTHITTESYYPIILNPDPILLKLKPPNDVPNDSLLVNRVEGWQISETDSAIIESGQKFFKKLNRKIKNPSSFNKDEFFDMLKAYLEKNSEIVGVSVGVDPSDGGYVGKLVEKFGFLMSQEVLGLVIEACVILEVWELLEGLLLVNGLVKQSSSSTLVYNLIVKRRSDLVCLCLKNVAELQSSDMLSIFKYFLSPDKNSYTSMVSLRKDWESEALAAIEKASDKSLGVKKMNLAKEASLLLTMAYDGFSASEMCLHYFLALRDLDEVVLSSCISKLNGSEMMRLIRYLGKWLRKYEKFPQACPCPKASAVLGLKACEWVPPLVNVVKCFGLVIDEHFSSLVLHPEFHEELRALEEVANSLSSEVRLCCTVANLVEHLKAEVRGE